MEKNREKERMNHFPIQGATIDYRPLRERCPKSTIYNEHWNSGDWNKRNQIETTKGEETIKRSERIHQPVKRTLSRSRMILRWNSSGQTCNGCFPGRSCQILRFFNFSYFCGARPFIDAMVHENDQFHLPHWTAVSFIDISTQSLKTSDRLMVRPFVNPPVRKKSPVPAVKDQPSATAYLISRGLGRHSKNYLSCRYVVSKEK